MKPPATLFKNKIKLGLFKGLIFTLQVFVVVISPATLTTLALFYVWKQMVMQIGKLMGKEFIGSVGPLDLIFVSDTFTKNPHSVVPIIHILEGIPDIKKIAADLQKLYDEKIPENKNISKYWRLAVHPRKFLGYWVWENVNNFKIENQIHILNDEVDSESALPLFIEKILRREIKDGMPLWEILVVKNYLNNPAKCLVILRISHCITDGITILKLHYKLSGIDKLPQTVPLPKEEKVPIWRELLSFGKLVTCGLYNYLDIQYALPDENPIRNLGNHISNGKWICSMTNRLDVALIKKAKKDGNCSFFDVLLCGIIGGVRKYMKKYFPNEPIPSDVHAVLPAPKPNHPNDTIINHWNFLIMKIPVPLKKGELDNLEEIKRSTRSSMAGTYTPFSLLVLKILSTLPLASYSEALTNFNGLTLLCSTVQGPEMLPLFGLTSLEFLYFMPINRKDIAALSWCVYTCGNQFRICMTADTAYISTNTQFDDLANMIENEFKSLSKTH